MKPEKHAEQLSRFLKFILGRSPDEFGLYLDPDGWCKIKTILQVLSEEDGWKHVRKGNINDIFVLISKHGLEQNNDCIRAEDRSLLPKTENSKNFPKILFTCVRQRAYPHVHKKGVSPISGKDSVIMTADEQLALRIGKRIDQNPVKLTVRTHQLIDSTGIISKYGENLFITPYIPFDCFHGPPLPDERKRGIKDKKPNQPENVSVKPHENYGAFFPTLEDEISKKESRQKRSKKEIAWKKERRMKKRR